MAPVKEIKRDRIHTFRLTESEEQQVLADMASVDCLSLSKYVRYLLLRKKVPVQSVKITDRSLRNQINEISAKISRIGSNYNQVVKRYNSSCLTRKKNGDPVINSKATIFYIEKLSDLTRELRQTQESLIETVSLIRLDEDER